MRDVLEAPQLDRMDRRIMELLTVGEDQQSIARLLGVSPSTISRRLKSIRRAILEN